MELTKENLERRRAEYLAQLEQAKANAHALEGAVQAVDGLLADLADPGPKKEEAQAIPETKSES